MTNAVFIFVGRVDFSHIKTEKTYKRAKTDLVFARVNVEILTTFFFFVTFIITIFANAFTLLSCFFFFLFVLFTFADRFTRYVTYK